MLETTLPGLTKWQFYAMATTLFIVGAAYCCVQFRLAFRDTIDDCTFDQKTTDRNSKIGLGLLIAMAFISYFFLPSLYYSIINDVSASVAETVVDAGAAAITGGDIDTSAYSVDLKGLIWGWPQNSDFQLAVYGMPLCAFLLGMCLYIGMAQPSPVSMGKKALKVLLQVALLVALLSFNNLHYFNGGELALVAGSIAASVALYYVTRADERDLANPPQAFLDKYQDVLPPPLPGQDE